MKNIFPNTLTGARVYYTGFDPRILEDIQDKRAYGEKIEREVKSLLLTKNSIVCAASHLTTKLVYDFFGKNTELIQNGIILPALRSDVPDFVSLLESKKGKYAQRTNIGIFYDENVNAVIRWQLTDNSRRFRKWFLNELKNPQSVLRKNILLEDSDKLQHIIDIIEDSHILSRSTIDYASKNCTTTSRKILRDFRELIYHISGATAVNCESAIPQEEYLDYSIADMDSKEILLSSHCIFTKIFLELIFNSLKCPIRTDAVLDLLSFDDIYTIRSIICNDHFINKYNYLVELSMKAICEDRNDNLYTLEKILEVRDIIQKNFTDELEKEVAIATQRKTAKLTRTIFHDVAVLSSSLLSIIPNPLALASGLISATLAVKETSPSFISNVTSICCHRALFLKNLKYENEGRDALLLRQLKKMGKSYATALSDTIGIMQKSIGERLKNSSL